jgi:hypothetical protein
MGGVEIALGALFGVLGARSLWYWGRRPFEGTDPVDHLLYALYLTGRVGMWFAFAGLFVLTALVDAPGGRPFLDEFAAVRWYLMVPVLLAALQFVTGHALGRRRPRAGTGPSGRVSRRPR